MRFIKKQLSWWRIVLIIGVAASAIGIAARVRATGTAVPNQRHENPAQPTANDNEDNAKPNKDSEAAVGRAVGLPQDDYYDRRREYWERRVERNLEDLDEEDADDEDSKDSKATKDSKDDAEDDVDDVDQELERRREYWRKRLDRDW